MKGKTMFLYLRLAEYDNQVTLDLPNLGAVPKSTVALASDLLGRIFERLLQLHCAIMMSVCFFLTGKF